MSRRLYSFRQAASELGMSRHRLAGWVKSGKVRAVQFDKQVKITAAELERIAEEGLEREEPAPRVRPPKNVGDRIRAIKI